MNNRGKNPFEPLRHHEVSDKPQKVVTPRRRSGAAEEQREQKEWVKWARARGLTINHQNNGAGTRARRIHLHQMGCTAGAPDIVVFNWLPAAPDARGLALEFKSSKGRQSTPQKDWQRQLTQSAEWRYHVVRSAQEAIDICRAYGL